MGGPSSVDDANRIDVLVQELDKKGIANFAKKVLQEEKDERTDGFALQASTPVSYTHLTLPTKA